MSHRLRSGRVLTPELGLGEQIAARIRTLLTHPGRAPVLVLGTIWPEYWQQLTAPPDPTAAAADTYAQARQLLAGTDVSVPDAFTDTDLKALRAADDPRLQHAADHARAGRVTQHLAGVPELLQRYRNAKQHGFLVDPRLDRAQQPELHAQI